MEVRDGPLVGRHRPSVDVLFRTVARYAGKNAVGVLLTGMGDDGASEMAGLRADGGRTIAESEETAVVWGRPGELVRRAGATTVLPSQHIAHQIANWVG